MRLNKLIARCLPFAAAALIIAPVGSAPWADATAHAEAVCYFNEDEWHAWVLAAADASIASWDPWYRLHVFAAASAGPWYDQDEDSEIGGGGSGRDAIWVQVESPSGYIVPPGTFVWSEAEASATGVLAHDEDDFAWADECVLDESMCEDLVGVVLGGTLPDDVEEEILSMLDALGC